MLTEIPNFKDEDDPLKLDVTIHEDNKNLLVNNEEYSSVELDIKASEHVQEGQQNCDFCGKTFPESIDIVRHIRGFHQHYQCYACSKIFSRMDGLKKHIHNIHEGHKDYKCESCGKAWTDARPLKNHINSGKCLIFKEVDVIRENLVSHKENDNHLKNYQQKCLKNYQLKFSCLDKFFDFVDVNLVEKKGLVDMYQFHFKCKKCVPKIDIKSDSRAAFSNLKTHIRRVHPELLGEYSELRKSTFQQKMLKRKSLLTTSNISNFRQKVEIVQSKNRYACACEACFKIFFAPEFLSKHINRVHKGSIDGQKFPDDEIEMKQTFQSEKKDSENHFIKTENESEEERYTYDSNEEADKLKICISNFDNLSDQECKYLENQMKNFHTVHIDQNDVKENVKHLDEDNSVKEDSIGEDQNSSSLVSWDGTKNVFNYSNSSNSLPFISENNYHSPVSETEISTTTHDEPPLVEKRKYNLVMKEEVVDEFAQKDLVSSKIVEEEEEINSTLQESIHPPFNITPTTNKITVDDHETSLLITKSELNVNSKPIKKSLFESDKQHESKIIKHIEETDTNAKVIYDFDNAIMKCDTCGKSFSESARLKKHILSIHKGYLHCGLCGNSYPKKEELISHIHEIHKKGDYNCKTCNKNLRSERSLLIHQRRFHEPGVHEESNKLTCDSCGKLFLTQRSLKLHIQTIHEGENDFKCDTCPKSFQLLGNLKRHKRYGHFKCDTCGKSLSSLDWLQYHIDSVHEGRKNHKCSSCDKAYTLARHLNQHIRSVHGNKNNRLKIYKQKFSCLDEFFDFVDVNLVGKKHLVDIYQFHFKCKKCVPKIDVTTDSRAAFSNLKTHIIRVHPEFLRSFSELRKKSYKQKNLRRKLLLENSVESHFQEIGT